MIQERRGKLKNMNREQEIIENFQDLNNNQNKNPSESEKKIIIIKVKISMDDETTDQI